MTLRLISSYSTILLFLFLSFPALAQDSLFYDKDWQKCKRPEAVYYGFFTKEKGKWVQRDYFLSNHQLQSEGAYSSKKKEEEIGKWIWYYENGQKERESFYKNGALDGVRKKWFENGQINYKGQYQEDEQIGLWEYWYPSGKKKADERYEPDWKPVNFWLENGEQILKEGNGKLIGFHTDGAKKYEGEIKNHFRAGLWMSWHEDGSVLERAFFDEEGLATATHQFFHPNGQIEYEGIRKKGKKVGKWVYRDTTGQARYMKDHGPEGGSERVYEFGYREPFPLNMEEVRKAVGYPTKAINNGLSGQVIVRILIDKQGKYVKHKIFKYKWKILKDRVELFVPDLVFSSAVMDTKRIKFWVNVPFNFKLLN